MSQLRIENDMVTTFFDNITKLSDNFTFSFFEELKKDARKTVLIIFCLDRSDNPDPLPKC